MRIPSPSRLAGATPPILLGCLGAAVIAGCGSSSTPKTTAQQSSVAGKSPMQVLQASAAALRRAGSFRMHGTMTVLSTPPRRTRMSAEFYSAHAVSIEMSMPAGSLAMIVDGKHAYMKADARFWDKYGHSAAAGTLFAGRWLLFPARGAHSFTSGLSQMSPSHLASCMSRVHGHLSFAGHTTVDGKPAVILRNKGDYPGGQPETMAIATTGAPYPLQVTATGKQRPGGTTGPCGRGSGPAADGTLLLTDFGRLRAPHIPAHPVNMSALEHGTAAGSTSGA